MTLEEFNALEFLPLDYVQISMIAGGARIEMLYQGHAYEGMGERTQYLTGEIIQAIPPQILILGYNADIEGIYLSEIEQIILVARG